MGNGRIINLQRGKKVTFDYNYLEGTNLFDTCYNDVGFSPFYSVVDYLSYYDDDEGMRYKLTNVKTNGDLSAGQYGIYFFQAAEAEVLNTLKNGHTYTMSYFAKANKTVPMQIGSERGLFPRVTLNTDWQRISVTATLTDSQYSAFILYMYDTSITSFDLEIKDIEIAEVSGVKSTTKFFSPMRTITETPTRTGFTFLGWYDKPIGGNQVTKFDRLTTVYAHWKQNTWSKHMIYDSTKKENGNGLHSSFAALKQNSASGSISMTVDSSTKLPKITATSNTTSLDQGFSDYGIVTKGFIDVTHRSKIVAEVSTGSLGYIKALQEGWVIKGDSEYTQATSGPSGNLFIRNTSTSVKKLELDVSSATGEFYINVTCLNVGGSNSYTLKNIYVE